MTSIIITSAIISLITSLLMHWFTITQVTKWFDKFFEEQTQIMKKYTEDVINIVNRNL